MLILLVRLLISFLQEILSWEWLGYLAIGAILIFLISLCDELNDRFKRIPFGPMRVPLFGNRVQLAFWGGPDKAITKLGQSYGSGFMKIFFGLTGYVSVNGTERIREVIGAEEWAGERDPVWRIDRMDKGSTTSSMVWSSRRSIAVRCLKEHAFSKKETLNLLITKQVSDFLDGIERQERVDKQGRRELSADTFLPFILSTIWSVLTGEGSVEVTDRRVQTLHRCLKEWEEASVALSGWADYYPWMLRWFPGWSGESKLQEVNHDFRKVLKCLIKEQYNKAEKGGKLNPESYVQACVREFKELRKRSFGDSQMNDSSSIALLFEFLCPGPLIAASHIGICLSRVARDPVAQSRIASEVHSSFGREDVPTASSSGLDEQRMPFTSAFILECFRVSSVVPFERRKLLKVVHLGDMRFPKDMPLLINYHSANVDPKVWSYPETFDPLRFLSPSGHTLLNQEKLISVEGERRLCAGEPLLRMILFSFLTGTLQKYVVEMDPHWVDKGENFGILNKPHPFKVRLKPRD